MPLSCLIAIHGVLFDIDIQGQCTSLHCSTLFGVYYFTMQHTGAIFAPIMGGFIDRWGFYVCFTIAGCTVLVVTAACSLFLRGSQD